MVPSVVGQVRFLTGSARVHASTGRRAGEDLAFERHLAGAERSPLSPPQTSSRFQAGAEPASEWLIGRTAGFFAVFSDCPDRRRRVYFRPVAHSMGWS